MLNTGGLVKYLVVLPDSQILCHSPIEKEVGETDSETDMEQLPRYMAKWKTRIERLQYATVRGGGRKVPSYLLVSVSNYIHKTE